MQLVLAAVQSPNSALVVVGDFNIHVDVPSDVSAVQLNDILNDHCLQQHVRESTHKCGHILDLEITSADHRLT